MKINVGKACRNFSRDQSPTGVESTNRKRRKIPRTTHYQRIKELHESHLQKETPDPFRSTYLVGKRFPELATEFRTTNNQTTGPIPSVTPFQAIFLGTKGHERTAMKRVPLVSAFH